METEITTQTGWNTINIKQYIQLYQIKVTEGDEDEFALNQMEAFLKQIAIIKGLSINEVENIPYSEFQNIKSDLQFLTTEPDQTQLKKVVEYDGVKYLMKENLAEWTLGEWIDVEAFNKDCINNMHRILSILYRHEDQTTYNPAICDSTAEVFLEKMDIETALSAFFLFYLFAMNYTPSDIQDYSVFQKMQKAVIEQTLLLKKEQNQ